MDETGQPGAATPGEHGDEPGQHDDLGSASAWAPPGAGWPRVADGGSRDESRSRWRLADQGHEWASSSPRHGDLPAPVPGADEVAELPTRVTGRRLNGHAHRDASPVEPSAPVSAPPDRAVDACDSPHGRLAVPAQRPAPVIEQIGEPRRDGPALRHPTGEQPVVSPDSPTGRPPGDGRPTAETQAASGRPADAGPLRQPTGGHPVLSAEGRSARHASDEPPGAGHAEPRAEGNRPTSVPPAQAADPDHRSWAAPDQDRPAWAGGGWTPPWSREGGGRRARVDRHRDDDEPAGRRSREDRPRDETPPNWGAAPSGSRAAESRRGEPTEPIEPVTPLREPEPHRLYPSVEQTGWASGTPSETVPSPADPAEPSPRPEPRPVRPFRLRPEGDGPRPAPTAGRHPDRAPSTGPAGRVAPTPPVPTSVPPYAARRSAPDPVPPAAVDRQPGGPTAELPQRVPAEPDVPVVPEPPAVEPPAQTPELARIATHLRQEDEPAPPQERPEGFDVNAILDAVRGVAGVRDASLRRTPAGAHSLRLDLSDGADAAEVSRVVARLLQERMGLAAAPQDVPGTAATAEPPVRRRIAPPPEGRAEVSDDARRRRRQPGTPRGRASVEEQPTPWAAFGGAPPGARVAAAPGGPAATGSPVVLGASYSGAQRTTTETAPSRPLDNGGVPGPRVVIDHVQVSTFGLDADVEVRLLAGARNAAGRAVGPAVDGYVLRLCAVAAAAAVDELLRVAGSGRGRCFVEHAAVVPFGTCEVATVVVLLVCDGWVEQLAGSALVSGGDPRQAVVRATLAAVNRRLEALLT